MLLYCYYIENNLLPTMKKTKMTQKKQEYVSFERIVCDSINELFHPSSEKKLLNYKDLHFVRFKEVTHFFTSMIDKEHIKKANYLFSLRKMSLIDTKSLTLINTKELALVDTKALSVYLDRLGMVSTAFILYLGIILSYLSMNVPADELRASISAAQTQKFANLHSPVHIANASDLKEPHYLAYLSKNEGQVKGVNNIKAIEKVVTDNSFSDCSFKADQKKFYTSESTISLKKGQTINLCVTDESGNKLSANWLFGNKKGSAVNSNCVAFSADSGSSTNVNLVDDNSMVVKSCSISFAIK